MVRRIIVAILAVTLSLQQAAFAQAVPAAIPLYLPVPFSDVPDKLRPMHLRSLELFPKDGYFRLILDRGSFLNASEGEIKQSADKLMNYFLVALALPASSFWVNLRPDSPDNVVDPYLEQTEPGKILLEADLRLKKDLALATSPAVPEGKIFWSGVNRKAKELFGSQEVAIPAFTRPWIVPDEIVIKQSPAGVYICKATLKVMLEEDYLASGGKKGRAIRYSDSRLETLNTYSSSLVRELVIPKLTREVNSSARYAQLRQFYYSLILAAWYKQAYRGKPNPYAQVIDSRILSNGLNTGKTPAKEYFSKYKRSFEKGEYSFLETVSTSYGQSVRQYISGGVKLADLPVSLFMVDSYGPQIRLLGKGPSSEVELFVSPGQGGLAATVEEVVLPLDGGEKEDVQKIVDKIKEDLFPRIKSQYWAVELLKLVESSPANAVLSLVPDRMYKKLENNVTLGYMLTPKIGLNAFPVDYSTVSKLGDCDLETVEIMKRELNDLPSGKEELMRRINNNLVKVVIPKRTISIKGSGFSGGGGAVLKLAFREDGTPVVLKGYFVMTHTDEDLYQDFVSGKILYAAGGIGPKVYGFVKEKFQGVNKVKDNQTGMFKEVEFKKEVIWLVMDLIPGGQIEYNSRINLDLIEEVLKMGANLSSLGIKLPISLDFLITPADSLRVVDAGKDVEFGAWDEQRFSWFLAPLFIRLSPQDKLYFFSRLSRGKYKETITFKTLINYLVELKSNPRTAFFVGADVEGILAALNALMLQLIEDSSGQEDPSIVEDVRAAYEAFQNSGVDTGSASIKTGDGGKASEQGALGGIDLSNLALDIKQVNRSAVQAEGKTVFSAVNAVALPAADAEKLWQGITAALSEGVIPAAEPIRRYLLSVCANSQDPDKLEQARVVLLSLLRLEEDYALASEPGFLNLLLSLEKYSGDPRKLYSVLSSAQSTH